MEQNAKCFVVDGRVRRAHLTFKGSVTGAMNEGDREPRFRGVFASEKGEIRIV
jgi:hypothetical protein